MHGNRRAVIRALLAVGVLTGCSGAEAPQIVRPSPGAAPVNTQVDLYPTEEPEIRFGRARIALGMDKQEVLEQIRLSRAQYDPLMDESSPERYVQQPPDDMIRSDAWTLTCPNRNSDVLGGGGGFMLKVEFHEGKVVKLSRGPILSG